MERILSNQNQHVKDWYRLRTKKGRLQQHAYLLEGWHLVKEALVGDHPLETVMVVENRFEQYQEYLKHLDNLILISESIANHIASTKTPQGIFAVASLPNETKIPTNLNGQWLLLDQIQDAGNIGTMVRTADAAGFSGVVFGDGTASQFTPKVVRSMQGSQFHLKIYNGDLSHWIHELKAVNVPVYGSELNPAAIDVKKVTPQPYFAIIMGNEGNGMQEQLLKATTANLYIPMKGNAESLNVAIAAGILMFQLTK